MKGGTSVAPETVKYTSEHEWVLRSGADTVRVGITDYAQQQLGDVVFVQLPDVGDSVEAGAGIGEVESTKSVSDIYAPLSGEVVARNEELDDRPELINTEPRDGGWMFELKLSDSAAWDELLDEAAYQKLIDQG